MRYHRASMGKLWSWVTGGADELGWDDLIRRVAQSIAETAHYGARGAVSFPPELEVSITVGDEAVAIARDFVARPSFDRDVAAQIANRCDCSASELPLRSYEVEAGERLRVEARARTGAAAARWVLRIEGGDRDGEAIELPASRPEIRFGRGPWHGADRQVTNDVIVAEESAFVSRRAGRLLASGHRFEVEALDQRDDLCVCRADGERLRPSRSASGRATLRPGDAIELADGGGQSIRLVLERPQA